MLKVKKSPWLLILVYALFTSTAFAQSADSISTDIDRAAGSLKSSNLTEEAKTAVNDQLEKARNAIQDSRKFDNQLKQYEQDVLQLKINLPP